MGTARELIDSSIKLFSLPEIYYDLQSRMNDPESSMAEIGLLIQKDPGMTARLLRVVNSAYFGLAAPVETVTRAVVMLGTQQIHDLVLATAVTSCFDKLNPRLIDMDRFWNSSVRCAVASQLLAQRCNVLDAERLFVAGLLSEIGHLVMFERVPEETQNAMVRARVEAQPVWEVERETFGFHYGDVGAELMKSWKLPMNMQEVTRLHNEPQEAERAPLEASIVHIARHITDWKEDIEFDPYKLLVSRYAWQLTGLEPEATVEIRTDTGDRAGEVLMLLRPAARRRAS